MSCHTLIQGHFLWPWRERQYVERLGRVETRPSLVTKPPWPAPESRILFRRSRRTVCSGQSIRNSDTQSVSQSVTSHHSRGELSCPLPTRNTPTIHICTLLKYKYLYYISSFIPKNISPAAVKGTTRERPAKREATTVHRRARCNRYVY